MDSNDISTEYIIILASPSRNAGLAINSLAKSLLQEGKVPKLDKILEDSDEEELPDQEIQVPEHKVKLIVGAGGEKIKFIQRKSKCQIQVWSQDVFIFLP